MAIRNNVVIVMCDLCVRYTTMADKYIPDISACLKDPEPFIRRQTLILLTNLLQASDAVRRGGGCSEVPKRDRSDTDADVACSVSTVPSARAEKCRNYSNAVHWLMFASL